jgi:selenocysteine lyase/cysteine desulfurase
MESTNRRGFMRQMPLLAAPALLPAISIAQLSSLLAAAPPGGEQYWQMVRRQFAFRESKVPMNAANLCPSPRVVADEVTELTRDIDLDCSFQNRAKFTGLLEASRQKVARHLGVSADEIALVRNTSEANNTINNGLSLKSGDEVVLWDQNHPTNNVAWDVRAARFGLNVKRIATPANSTELTQLIQVFTDAFTPRTRVLALTHVSNVSGLKLPVRELCQAAHRRGIWVHVDGAQSWGALDVNLRELDCDSYSASAHKWFVGPKEAGLLYVRQDRIPEVWPNVVAPGWGNQVQPEVVGARKFESLGQRDDAALAALATAADFHFTIGPAEVEARVCELTTALKQGLKEAGIELVTPLDSHQSAGVCVVRVPAARSNEIYNKLYEEHGIAGATTGGLRLCPHVYNTREHIDRAIQGVKALLAKGF